MAESTSNDLVEQAKWIAKAATSLDALINERADAKAEAALAKAYLEADEQIIARHSELAEALGVPAYTSWELLIAKVRTQAPERGDTQRKPDQPTTPLNAQDGASRG